MTTERTGGDARRAFLEERRKGVGGSDIGALCGVHAFGRTALDVFRDKVEPLPEVLPPPTPEQARGIALEPIIADDYEAETGMELSLAGTFCVPGKPHLRASPDRFINSHGGFLEIKCPGLHVFSKLRYEGIIEQYQLQAQHYFMVLNRSGPLSASWMDFRFFNAERWTGISVRQEPDLAIQKAIEEVADHFWHEHVLRELPPSVDGYSIALPKNDVPVMRLTDPERLEALHHLRVAKEARKDIEAAHELAVQNMLAMLPGFGTYEADGDDTGRVHRLTLREQDGRRTLDAERLAGAGLLDPQRVRQVFAGAIDDTIIEQCRADLESFYKRGEPFSVLTLYPNAKAR
jgi:predicted phage-related endonuclease